MDYRFAQIKKVFEQRGIDIAEVAKTVIPDRKHPLVSLSNQLSGRCSLRTATVSALATELGMSTDDLLRFLSGEVPHLQPLGRWGFPELGVEVEPRTGTVWVYPEGESPMMGRLEGEALHKVQEVYELLVKTFSEDIDQA